MTTAIHWAKVAFDFARAVLPDLLSHLGKDNVGQAFEELGKLYEKFGGDWKSAHGEIRNIKPRGAEIAKNRSKRDKQLKKLRDEENALTPGQRERRVEKKAKKEA